MNEKIDLLKIIGLIAIGIVIGMALGWFFIFISVDSFVNNILPNIHVENIVFNLNETALVESMNNTFGGFEEITEELKNEESENLKEVYEDNCYSPPSCYDTEEGFLSQFPNQIYSEGTLIIYCNGKAKWE